jgi:hypothetical protein
MKCILYFYLLAQLAASYFIHLHLSNDKIYTHLVLLIVATLTYALTSIKDVSLSQPSPASVTPHAYNNKMSRNKK